MVGGSGSFSIGNGIFLQRGSYVVYVTYTPGSLLPLNGNPFLTSKATPYAEDAIESLVSAGLIKA